MRRPPFLSAMNDELLESLRADEIFVTSNAMKSARERSVLDAWLAGECRVGAVVEQGGDPPDFTVDGCGVEVVEVLERMGHGERQRRRSHEYRTRVALVERGGTPSPRLLPGLKTVQARGHLWILETVQKKIAKYNKEAASDWTLLVYANFSWSSHVRWDLLRAGVAEAAPPFAAIDILEASGSGVHRVFDRPTPGPATDLGLSSDARPRGDLRDPAESVD